ncbi:yrdC [Wigglesworthia glossinidia endosymbiont of Glossina brevipalpis]|uniref:Threonylcarbamoyl-AMP synthase n=1 Tax=Wigglesworthia glossinidia brevipalpis TaxID=36870 RepID=TSAC_WIGBR|nr:RecName: Full=Threonylcarbamoyl-AMP synthase; Short=TC-AMP synthase; AltName: Full=L-threonylcarbamoyladenylate synthase; AltName: Full=t(6)A37 threonylcarbamoyladenosine biosynthesis protein TsaC; AltName: Full=tRNA threonylcarbamoyladenosine biosynthesis protein TsaC [Wigglesworthia glossinidia endosymbiont of Glossina brevipalpis]BAC24643.1 yrdC [Wigglesworthia glossinidia endosymbiont of Glossina brevipalpis]
MLYFTIKNMKFRNLMKIINALREEEVVAYPTESMFGLGCDPDSISAVNKLIYLKKRKINKGFIIVAANISQLNNYIDCTSLSKNNLNKIFCTWPGFITWLMPPKKDIPCWLIGNNSLIAVRVSNFFPIKKICNIFGKPIISTSANLSGEIPAKNIKEIKHKLGSKIIILDHPIGKYSNPSEIRNGINYKIIRKG